MSQKIYTSLIIIILAFFALSNVRSSHDWGGDFSAYLAQATNLSEGRPMCDFGYIYNSKYDRLAPPCYPPGYPLLLAPVIYFFGGNLWANLLFQNVLGVLFLLCALRLFRWRLNPIESVLLLGLFALNPWMWTFKSELTADLPFSLFFMISYLSYLKFRRREEWWSMAVTGLLVGFTISIKLAGLALLLPLMLDMVLYERSTRSWKFTGNQLVVFLSVSVLSVFGFFALTDQNFFDGLFHFGGVTSKRLDLVQTVSTNIYNYFSTYMSFFQKDVGPFEFLALLSGTGMLWLTLIGFVRRVFNNPGVAEWNVISFVGLLIAFPITNGLRYLVPVLPFLLRYAFEAIPKGWEEKVRNRYAFWIAALMILQYFNGWQKIWSVHDPVVGPQQTTELWEVLKSFPENPVVVADKPRVVAYFGEVSAMSVSPDTDSTEVLSQIEKLSDGQAILLSIRATPNPAIDRFFKEEWKDGEQWRMKILNF